MCGQTDRQTVAIPYAPGVGNKRRQQICFDIGLASYRTAHSQLTSVAIYERWCYSEAVHQEQGCFHN